MTLTDNMNSKKLRVAKWREVFKRDSAWNTKLHQKTKIKEAQVISTYINSLSKPTIEVLEIGCGDGSIGSYVLESSPKVSKWHFTDLLNECIVLAKKNVKDKERAEFRVIDAGELLKYFPKKSVDFIVSTGFASAATYPEVVPGVSDILKPGGMLIVDFVNHFNLGLVKDLPRNIFKYVTGKHYHLGPLGIAQQFAKYNLRVQKIMWPRNFLMGPVIFVFIKD